MTTPTEAAVDLYGQLKPSAIHAMRDYILSRTPPELQDEMIATFEADLAQAPTGPPTVVDAPFVSQTGSTLNCTLGNWDQAPTSRTYQWKRGATNVGINAATYTVTAPDRGQSFTCTMVAANAFGSSAPVVSNAIVAV
jgi:hypothetical protein